MKILVVDDESAIRALVGEILTDDGHDVTLAEDADSALELFGELLHDMVFTDIRMPGMSGIELLGHIKQLSSNTQVIIMTSHASMETSIDALKRGAYDYLLKPFDNLELISNVVKRAAENIASILERERLVLTLSRQNDELDELNKVFRDMAIRDGLTTLYNHRHAKERLADEVARAQRFLRPLSVLFMDIDNFKHYNDTHGHQAGDILLKEFADLILSCVRRSDTVARWGGEEFVIIAPETPLMGATELGERIRRVVASHHFAHRERQPLGFISVSMGIATLGAGINSANELIHQADAATYNAKNAGRNFVSLSTDPVLSNSKVMENS